MQEQIQFTATSENNGLPGDPVADIGVGMSQRYEQIDWYELPWHYDIVFSSRNRKEIEFLEAVYERYVGGAPAGRILEPACGTGGLMEGLLRKGYQVEGFDISEAMVEYSQKRLARQDFDAKVWVGDMADFRCRRKFDMAFCLVNSFKYLLSEKLAVAHLQCIASALRPGAVYVLGFHLSDYDDQRRDREDWVGVRGRLRVDCQIDSWPPERRRRREKLRARLVVRKPTKTMATESEWEFRTYDLAQFQSLLRKVPELAHVATHSFDYRADEEIELGEDDLDSVVILQRS